MVVGATAVTPGADVTVSVTGTTRGALPPAAVIVTDETYDRAGRQRGWIDLVRPERQAETRASGVQR